MANTRNLLFIIWGIFASCEANAAGDGNAPTYLEYPIGGTSIGAPYNTVTGEPIGSMRCVEVNGKIEKNRAGRQKISYYEVADKDLLRKALAISARAHLSGASISGNFARERNLEKDHFYVVASAEVISGGDQIGGGNVDSPPVALNSYAKQILGKKTPEELEKFRRKCGHGYVEATITGGKLVVSLDFQATKETVSEDIGARVRSSWGSASISSSFSSQVSTQKFEFSRDINGVGSRQVSINKSNVLRVIEEFPEILKDSTRVYMIKVVPYESLPDWPEARATAAETLAEDMLALSLKYFDLSALYREASGSRSNYYFPFSIGTQRLSDRQVAQLADVTLQIAQSLQDYAKGCLYDLPCDPNALANVALISKISPQLLTLDSLPRELQQSSVADVFYALLAIAPMRRLGVDSFDDEVFQAEQLCVEKHGNAPCDYLDRNLIAERLDSGRAVAAPASDIATAMYREWIYRRRVDPILSISCSTFRSNSLCTSSERVQELLRNVSVTFDREGNFASRPWYPAIPN